MSVLSHQQLTHMDSGLSLPPKPLPYKNIWEDTNEKLPPVYQELEDGEIPYENWSGPLALTPEEPCETIDIFHNWCGGNWLDPQDEGSIDEFIHELVYEHKLQA